MLPQQRLLILIILSCSIVVNCLDLPSLRIIDREPGKKYSRPMRRLHYAVTHLRNETCTNSMKSTYCGDKIIMPLYDFFFKKIVHFFIWNFYGMKWFDTSVP